MDERLKKVTMRLAAGGPYVFPSTVVVPEESSAETIHIPGMTLRDWFAGQALAGFCANPTNTDNQTTLADRAHKHADAMLKARTPAESSSP
jgi:hypothetical protein